MTLDDIKARCEEVGECWVWQGACGRNIPRAWIGGACVCVRNALWQAQRGPIPRRGKIGVREDCEARCCSPEHLVCRIGRLPSQPATAERIIRNALARRARSPLTPADVSAIRASEETTRVLGARYGITRGCVAKIKSGDAWRDL